MIKQNRCILKRILLAILFVVFVLLTGCGEKEEKLNSYRLEEIRGNQVVFARTYSDWNGIPMRLIWIYNKYGQCKRIDLMKNPEVEQNDKGKYLANLDACMADDKIPFLQSRLELPDEKISYCINVTEIQLSIISEGTIFDASGGKCYVVVGVRENRQLKALEDSDANGHYACENEILQEACQAIEAASEYPD